MIIHQKSFGARIVIEIAKKKVLDELTELFGTEKDMEEYMGGLPSIREAEKENASSAAKKLEDLMR